MKLKLILLSMLLVLSTIPLGFASTNNVAIVVSTPADAIIAAPYAKAMGYEIIVTPKDELSDDAKTKLKYINNVIIVGGPVAVSEQVENSIKSLGKTTKRIGGETRVETSIEMYKLIKKEKPEMLKNIVVVDGFDEKITPVAVSFGAPVLYYGLNKDDIVENILKTTNPENTIVIGKNVPKQITNTIVNQAKNTILATGSEKNIIKTSLSYVEKLNPQSKGKDVVVVYSEKSNDPILNGIISFVKGDAGTIVSIPNNNKDTINDIIQKVKDISSSITISSDDSNIAEKISDIATDNGISTITSETTTGGGGGGSTYVPPQTTSGPAIFVNASNKIVKFEGQDDNTLSIDGSNNIEFPKITANVNVVDKKDTSKNITIDFKDNECVKSVIEAMNNFNVIAYSGSNITITYHNTDMNGENVTLSVISNRKDFKNSITDLLNGNATKLLSIIEMNQYSAYNCTKTITNGQATWTIPASDFEGETVVVITKGNVLPWNATSVDVLATGGFLVPKYNMTLTYDGTNTITNDVTYNISLNQTPTNSIRYGLAMINKDVGITLNVVGTNPNNALFNVSVMGDGGSEIILENNDLISLNASKLNNIIGTIFSSNTASATYSPLTTNSTLQLTSQNITNSYVIGVAYDASNKKIVAIEQQ